MKISRDNPEFDSYDVYVSLEIGKPRTFLGIKTSLYNMQWKEVKLSHVVEADDDTGFVVQHLTDDNGNEIYTNGSDDIIVDNTVKFLMLNHGLRTSFLAAGFRPKLTSRYEKTLRLVRRVGETVKMSEALQTPDFDDERVQFDTI